MPSTILTTARSSLSPSDWKNFFPAGGTLAFSQWQHLWLILNRTITHIHSRRALYEVLNIVSTNVGYLTAGPGGPGSPVAPYLYSPHSNRWISHELKILLTGWPSAPYYVKTVHKCYHNNTVTYCWSFLSFKSIITLHSMVSYHDNSWVTLTGMPITPSAPISPLSPGIPYHHINQSHDIMWSLIAYLSSFRSNGTRYPGNAISSLKHAMMCVTMWILVCNNVDISM